jgi:hypothetical protein
VPRQITLFGRERDRGAFQTHVGQIVNRRPFVTRVVARRFDEVGRSPYKAGARFGAIAESPSCARNSSDSVILSVDHD